MGYLLEVLTDRKLDIQRDVVKNERRQNYENRPYGMAQMLIQPALFPAPHPYSWTTIGSPEDLDNASLEDIKSFFRRFYVPNNASLAIVGDFDLSEAQSLVERYFGDIPAGPEIDRTGRMDTVLSGTVELTTHDRVQLPRLYLAWPTVPDFSRRQPALDVISAILGDGRSSRAVPVARVRYARRERRARLPPRTGDFGRDDGTDHRQPRPLLGGAPERGPAADRTDTPGRRGRARAPARQEPNPGGARLPARTLRRVRRQGRPAQPLQHLRRRPRLHQQRHGRLPVAHHRRPARSRVCASARAWSSCRYIHRSRGPRPRPKWSADVPPTPPDAHHSRRRYPAAPRWTTG